MQTPTLISYRRSLCALFFLLLASVARTLRAASARRTARARGSGQRCRGVDTLSFPASRGARCRLHLAAGVLVHHAGVVVDGASGVIEVECVCEGSLGSAGFEAGHCEVVMSGGAESA